MNDKKCSHCNREMPSLQGGIITEIEGKQVYLCGACWNKFVSKEMEVDFEIIELKPIILEDCRGNQHAFHIFTRLVPPGLAIEAREIVDEERIGYKFEVLGSHDCNQEDLILELYEKIKRGLSMKYLEHGELGKQIKDMSVVGRIEWDDEYEGQIPELCIDGERITWYEFGKMLMTFEGWQFQLNIFDRTDEVTKSLN